MHEITNRSANETTGLQTLFSRTSTKLSATCTSSYFHCWSRRCSAASLHLSRAPIIWRSGQSTPESHNLRALLDLREKGEKRERERECNRGRRGHNGLNEISQRNRVPRIVLCHSASRPKYIYIDIHHELDHLRLYTNHFTNSICPTLSPCVLFA